MFELLDGLKQFSKLNVLGESYEVQSKTLYFTEGETQNWYAKLVLTGHKILVIAPFDDFMYFGWVENVFGESQEFPEKLTYNGKAFSKSSGDYQIVKEICFGDPLLIEGEVRYCDFNDEDDEMLVSLAWVSRTNQRADVVAQIISKDDIEVML